MTHVCFKQFISPKPTQFEPASLCINHPSSRRHQNEKNHQIVPTRFRRVSRRVRVRVRYKCAPLDCWTAFNSSLAYNNGQDGCVYHPHQKSSGTVPCLRDHFLVAWLPRISLERQSGMLYDLRHHPTRAED